MSKTPYKPRGALSLKSAVTQALTDLGGIHAVAVLPGVNRAPTTLFKYTDESEENAGRHIPLDLAALITAEAVRRGQPPRLLHWLRDQAMREAASDVPPDMPVLTAPLGQEVGEVFAALARVLDPASPGGVDMDAAERRAVLKELGDLKTLVEQAIDKVRG